MSESLEALFELIHKLDGINHKARLSKLIADAFDLGSARDFV